MESRQIETGKRNFITKDETVEIHECNSNKVQAIVFHLEVITVADGHRTKSLKQCNILYIP